VSTKPGGPDYVSQRRRQIDSATPTACYDASPATEVLVAAAKSG